MSLRVQPINGFCPNFNIFLFFNLIEFFLLETNANILFFNWKLILQNFIFNQKFNDLAFY